MTKRILGMVLCLAMVCCLLPVAAYGTEGAAISENNFPDAAFRSFVADAFDENDDGLLSEREIAGAAQLNVSGLGIHSLEGVAYLTELREIYCDGNNLTSLDLSNNTKLTILSCMDNQLMELNVSRCPELTVLECGNNRLTVLDLQNNTKLQILGCFENCLTSLDLRNTECSAPNCDGNRYSILVGEDRSFDLTLLPGFFMSHMAYDWCGGSVSDSILTVEPNASEVTYLYEIGDGYGMAVTLQVTQQPEEQEINYTLVLSGGRIYKDEDLTDADAGTELAWYDSAAAGIVGSNQGSVCIYTFREVHFMTTASQALFIKDDNAVVNLLDTNMFLSGDSGRNSIAITAQGNLTVRGSGRLSALAGSAGSYGASQGLLVKGTLTVESGFLEGAGGKGQVSIGIETEKDLIVSGGTVVANGGIGLSYGIWCRGLLNISGGEILAKGTEEVAFAVFADSLHMTDGTLTADASSAPEGYGLVFKTEKGASFTGGTVTLQGSVCASARRPGFAETPAAPLTNGLRVTAGTDVKGTGASGVSGWRGDGSDSVTNFRYMHLDSKTVAGDINGDGEVNNKDLTRLFQYLSGYEVAVEEASLDVNGDGSINNKDLTRLFQFLSGYDVDIF